MITFGSGTAGERIFFFFDLCLKEGEDPRDFGLGDEGLMYNEKRRMLEMSGYKRVFMVYPNPVENAGYESQLPFWENFVKNFGNDRVYLLTKLS